MEKSGTSIIFVLVCIGVLLAAYGIGICIREMRFTGVKSEPIKAVEKSSVAVQRQREQARRMPGGAVADSNDASSPEDRAELVEQRSGMRERFANMSDEEREAFRAQMRERFSGRRRGSDMGPQLQLTDEQRAQMREDIDNLRTNWEQMSEEEREKARNEITDKYGFTPRGLGSGRGFGDREGGRRRSFMRTDAEQTSPEEEQPGPDEEQTENN